MEGETHIDRPWPDDVDDSSDDMFSFDGAEEIYEDGGHVPDYAFC